jgi:NADH-quinone oxidoreductase subunit J
MVVYSRNMVYSAMFLILTFFNAAALFILVQAEFLAMLLIVVYVGAIAVLFLFVIMMMNVDEKIIKKTFNKHAPILITISIILFLEILLVIKLSNTPFKTIGNYTTNKEISNTAAIGKILYTDFILPFQICGGILFVAMIGAILLTLRDDNKMVRKQNIASQTSRSKENSLKIVKVKPNQGINI